MLDFPAPLSPYIRTSGFGFLFERMSVKSIEMSLNSLKLWRWILVNMGEIDSLTIDAKYLTKIALVCQKLIHCSKKGINIPAFLCAEVLTGKLFKGTLLGMEKATHSA